MTLEDVYNKMTQRFTSNHFGYIAEKHKVLSNREITNGAIAGYLRGKNCKRISNRTWEKTSDHVLDSAKYKIYDTINLGLKNEIVPRVQSVQDFLNQIPIESLINHITAKGYIVLTP